MAQYNFQKWMYDSTESSNRVTTIQVGTLDITLVAYYQQVIPFDFTLAVTPSSRTITQGSSAEFDVGVAQTAGDPETVGLSYSGLPLYATASFSVGAPALPPFSGILSILTSANTPEGSYPITITATSQSGVVHTSTVVLIVQTAEVPFDFNISASPASQAVYAGASTSFAVATMLLSGESESVMLVVSGLPSGATAAFSPANGLPPFASTLTIQTSPSTPTGSYSLSIAGYSSVDHSTPATLVVNLEPFNYSMSASPQSQSVTVGQSTTYAISTKLEAGISEPITLAYVEGLPANSTVTLSPTSGTPPFSSTMTVQTSPNTPTGSYNVTIAGFGSVDRSVTVALQVNPVEIHKGTILVSASIGTAIVSNGEGEITDSSGTVMASFTSTPFSWDQAVVGTEYTVVCRVAGYLDKFVKATVQAEGASVPATFQFVQEAGFPLWVVAVAGGTLVLGYFLKGRRKGGRRK